MNIFHRLSFNFLLIFLNLCFASLSFAATNVAPTVTIVSATMRTNTTFMDVTYRITDPDDATVKVRALAFVNGVVSFANVIRPTTFVEGTASNLGDNIPVGVDHSLTWDVGADWDIDLGNVSFEILCRDTRGLLPFVWLTIPSTTNTDEITISTNSPTDAVKLDALFWLYANGAMGLVLENGILRDVAESGFFNGIELVKGSTLREYTAIYLMKQMNLDPVHLSDINLANTARSGIAINTWHAANRPYMGYSDVLGWGGNGQGQLNVPAGLTNVTGIAAGNGHSLAMNNGVVVGWGYGSSMPPGGLSNVTAIATKWWHNLALNNDGTVVAWGYYGDTSVPEDLSNVTAIATGIKHNMALKSDGTVVVWGNNEGGQMDIPAGLSNVKAITSGSYTCWALKNDGQVVGWGDVATPGGLSDIKAIAGGYDHCLALKNDGTVIAWGDNTYGQITIPAGLSNVTALAAGRDFSLALRNDGTVAGWGRTGGINIPAGLSNVTAIAGGGDFGLVSKE